ncbi:NAD(P)-dependent oxidoreductase [Mycobacterium sp. smrl_JER01]|uniref:NAD(P)-dependent oxidoreductase n=1 Tax=Mycobacterium sp. smrl_JER01 TaxID=3402633 RepID=UPI003AC9AA0C
MNKVTFLGAGAMGTALAGSTPVTGYRATVWNRTPERAERLRGNGIAVATTAAAAVADADLIVVCLLDHASVHEVLHPIADLLSGRQLINVTTTSPDGARELARWSAAAGVEFLDGGIMATPEMIGTPASTALFSGVKDVFDTHRGLLEAWGTADFVGADAGLASLYDLALLAGMYTMFAGFFQGAAMVAPAGVGAAEFAARAAPWLQAMAPGIAEYAEVIDAGDYARPGQQSLAFSELTDIIDAGRTQGVGTEILDVVQRLIHRQIASGYGSQGFARVIESIRKPAAPPQEAA